MAGPAVAPPLQLLDAFGPALQLWCAILLSQLARATALHFAAVSWAPPPGLDGDGAPRASPQGAAGAEAAAAAALRAAWARVGAALADPRAPWARATAHAAGGKEAGSLGEVVAALLAQVCPPRDPRMSAHHRVLLARWANDVVHFDDGCVLL
jgi:hypothetical protein